MLFQVKFVAFAAIFVGVRGIYSPTRGPSYLPPVTGSSTQVDGPLITKQFYTISAPEEAQDVQIHTKHLVIGKPTRNYRVIFIKAPTAENAQLRYTAEVAPQEEKTVIYVLTRKNKELAAEDITAPTQQQQTPKPEVFFIKYKTNEEAAAAQREIQTQYDELGGKTEHAAPYVGPVQSVIGALDTAPYAQQHTQDQNVGSGPSSTGYDYQRPAVGFPSLASLAPPARPY